MSVGKIEPFDVTNGNWELYEDRIEQYFVTNKVDAAMKVATLITVVGSEAYELMVNLCTPDKPSSKTYKELVAIMKAHLQPKPSIVAERFKFRQRMQKQEESIAEYAAELKRLSKDCKFSSDNLKENLRDQFVCGLYSDSIRQRLFTEEDVKFDLAFKIAVAIEAAERQSATLDYRGLSKRMEFEQKVSVATMHALKPYKGKTLSNNKFCSPDWQREQASGPAGGAGRGTRAAVAGGARRASMAAEAGAWRDTKRCDACGGQHESKFCKFRIYVCRVCNQQGHLKKVCPRVNRALHNLREEMMDDMNSDNENSDEVNNFSIEIKGIENFPAYIVNVKINNIDLPMEIDTGSVISCISDKCYQTYFKSCVLQHSDLKLRYYTGECIVPMGKITPLVIYNDICKALDLYVVRNAKVNLLGRHWINELLIKLPLTDCKHLNIKNSGFNLNQFSFRFYEVFEDGLGRFSGGKVGFCLREGARPIFLRARPLAYALREPVERELDRLMREGVITPVTSSDWATPIVPVMKKDGSIRICGDFKLTLNKCLEVDRYPLPRVEDLLAKLHGGQKFSKIDLSQAYAQFELDDSSKFTVINTHKGLFRYNRLIYGLASSPGIFQRKLEQLFGDMAKVGVFLDDVIITGINDEDHIATLTEVFCRLQKYGLKIRKDKCVFFAESVTYLGFVISRNGIQTCQKKVEAIKQVPIPTNVSQLRSLLGLVMYYARFVPHISTLLAPLYNLLKKDAKFEWNLECMRALEEVKNLLISSPVLAHYSPYQPLLLTADASSVGLGGVISHITPEGERPVAYASRSLNDAERAYSQIEREALAIIYGVKKFHQYLYGREFTLRTDHKPLVTIFGDKTGIPVMAASRMQRWAVLLAGYNFKIEYVKSKDNAADALSRLPVGKPRKYETQRTYINFIQRFLPVDRETVKQNINKDDTLKKVIYFLQSGWPSNLSDENMKPYYTRRNELYLDMGCVVWGYRLVIPTTLRDSLLQELHIGHMGIVKMKSMARSIMWWPGIDADIERVCRECATCAAESTAPPRVAPQPWPYIPEPWTRLHVDFLGPIQGKTFLIIIDSTTKWLEIFNMQRTTAAAVIRVLRETFARFGLPKQVVSDNGPPFSSREYVDFMALNGIKLSYASIYHPSSNGAAEGAVKLCKRAIKKACRDGCDLEASLQAFLMAYRNVNHSTTGHSPAMLLQRRSLRSRLDLLTGLRNVEDRVAVRQVKQSSYAGGSDRSFQVGENVWFRDYTKGSKWLQGWVESVVGSRHYIIGREDGPPVKRHIDQIKGRGSKIGGLKSSPSSTFPISLHGNSSHTSLLSPAVTRDSAHTLNNRESAENNDSGNNEPPLNDPRPDESGNNEPPLNDPGPSRILRPRNLLNPIKRYGFE